MDKILGIHNLDARKLNLKLKGKIVDVTITSPPYYDMKDYNHQDQIGFGQTYKQYLKDLQKVFREVYKVTKETGTLWVIIDVFRRAGEVTPLPFDFTDKIKNIGWKLQEIIVWEKDKAVPWTSKGQMRNSFEYILVFSKTSDYKFYIDRVKDFTTLKKWWVKYPERYNPNGKTPSAIWRFPIPTQGGWGKGYIRHFCPLPEDLIAQILKITTNEGDIVLDPFAGSGTVLSKADNMKRKYVGFELNKEYIEMFESYLRKTGEQKRLDYEQMKSHSIEQSKFQELILNLRTLKYARILFQNLEKTSNNFITSIFVEKSNENSVIKNKFLKVNYHLLVNDSYSSKDKSVLEESASKPPLSNFGIESNFLFYQDEESFSENIKENEVFTYTDKSTHVFKRKITKSELLSLKKNEIILSNIGLEIDEKQYN